MAIGVLLASLPLVIAIPALAATSSKATHGRSAIPKCTGLSPTKMASVLGSTSLQFKKKVPHSNLCTWEAIRPGHYRELLVVDIIPGIKSIYETAEADGKKSAAREGKSFGRLTLSHAPWKAAFDVSGSVYNTGLEACEPGHKRAEFGPPQCSSDPDWTTVNVDSYNSKLMVSVGAAAQLGDVYLSHVIALNEDILAGKIH
ncbi:MAG: hypothetical protein WB507_02285 [Solirubrobacterales bacterium]